MDNSYVENRIVFINLTPHPVDVYDRGSGKLKFTIPKSKLPPARMEVIPADRGTIKGVPVNKIRYEDTFDLPPPVTDTVYIVSTLVAMHNAHRIDLLAPDTDGNVMRNEDGEIIGTCGFVHF